MVFIKQQDGPQHNILACCMAKNLDIVCECMCAKTLAAGVVDAL